jgi:Cu/Ag efflux pump CusA
VRVGQIATLSVVAGQQQLTREDLAPFIGVTARLEGRDLGSAMAEIRTTVAGLNLPPSLRVVYGGLYAEQQKRFVDLSQVFAAALLLSALTMVVGMVTELMIFYFAEIDRARPSISPPCAKGASAGCGRSSCRR